MCYNTRMPRTTKQQQKTLYLPPDLIERWQRSAKKNHRSMNSEAIVALEFYLDTQEAQEKKIKDEKGTFDK